ncbi:catalase family protein [Novosphingobium olei]|uniref:catalase family protein n=1 Tax=Novosphingobium olei TaxID=2728851 RepID=UPI003092EDE9|nr:catalase family protein [Novosphingobium olei]
MIAPPIPYSPSLEQPLDDEDETDASLEASFAHILETTFKDYGKPVRAVHAKAHALFEGTFTVDATLPRELAQGLFAQPGEYRAALRVSTNPGDILDDNVVLPRGLALKVEGVGGEMLPDADGDAQDFLMVNAPIFAAPSAKKFAGKLKLLAATTDRAEGAKVALSSVLGFINGALGKVGLESGALAAMGGARQVHPLGETYFSTTPFRHGDYVAKYRLRPISPSLTALAGTEIDTSGRPDGLRETLREDARSLTGEWAFEVQLLRDLDKQPIEDASVEWKEDEAPFVQVATLRIEPQDSWSAEKVARIDEALHFSPWNGLAAHQPLGNVNRARRRAYKQSADFRATGGGCPMATARTAEPSAAG